METLLLLGGLAGVGMILHESNKKTQGAAATEGFLNASGPLVGGPPVASNPPGSTGLPVMASGRVLQPQYRGRVTQNHENPDAHRSFMESMTGNTGDVFQHKTEVAHMGVVSPDTGNPFGMPTRTDFMQQRETEDFMLTHKVHNQAPVQRQTVARGLGLGYTTDGAGGFQQVNQHDFAMPKTVEELRSAANPKMDYSTDPVPGVSRISNPTLAQDVPHYRPDRSVENGMQHLSTNVTFPKPPAWGKVQVITQNRETTDQSEWFGPAGLAAAGAQSYLRSVFKEVTDFFRLHAGTYFGGTSTFLRGPVSDEAARLHSRQTYRHEVPAYMTSHGAGDFRVNGVAEMGAATFKHDDSLYSFSHVNNPAVSNPAGAGVDMHGEVTYKPEVGQSAHVDRVDPALYAHLTSNPYKVPSITGL